MKNVIIIGGGISGLTVLHTLKKKYSDDINITLLEKNNRPGGTASTEYDSGLIIERGVNGFLNSKPHTLQLMNELGLKDQLLVSEEAAAVRYIARGKQLLALPRGPQGMLTFRGLNIWQKLRLLREPFVAKGGDALETVHGFGTRRLGRGFADTFLDPMVSGVFGGDASTLVLSHAFPRIHEMEQAHGSLIRAAMALKKERKRDGNEEPLSGQPRGRLMSLHNGMSQLTQALFNQYEEHIRLNQNVVALTPRGERWEVRVNGTMETADELFLCAPAYACADILKPACPDLAGAYERVPYAPLAVVAAAFKTEDLPACPRGFGYLIPSRERTPVLGVLFDSQVFPNRAAKDDVLMRVMIGGSRHPGILSMPDDDLLNTALAEIGSKMTCRRRPWFSRVYRWPHAIPQYTVEYVQAADIIRQASATYANLHLAANYLGGVAFNDCIANARAAAGHLTL